MLLHLLLLWLAQAQGGEKPKLCAISGTVVNAATGEPVRKAEVSLMQADVAPGSGSYPNSYRTTADAAGKFAIKDIEAGKYRMVVQRTGFVFAEYGSRGPGRQGATLSLDAGQELKDISIRMTPHAVISGRVLDEDGDPVAYAQIQVMRYRYTGNGRQLSPAGGASTNDLGEYRAFGLAPGRYYVSANYQNRNFGPAGVDRSAATGPEEGYVPTWYPGTTDQAGASTVDVQPGALARGVDFTLSKVRTVRVRGKVNRPPGMPGRGLTVMLTPRSLRGYMGAGNRTQVDAQGNFILRGVAPGTYYLYADLWDQDRSYSAHQPLDVGSTDIENVTLTIQPGMDVSGQVKVEGTDTPPSLTGVNLFLRPRESGVMMFMPNEARAGENGSFTLKGVQPELYDLTAYGLPGGYYVKAVRLGDEEALDAGLNLTRGAAPITVVLSPGAGEVSGVVQNDKPEPVPGATVVLVPSSEAARKRAQFYKSATTDQYGRYTLKNIDPGEYKLFAWEDVEQGAWQDPEFLKPVESRGHDITIREKGSESVQLDVIPAEAAQAPTKKQ